MSQEEEPLLGARAEFVLIASLFEAIGVEDVRRRILYKCITPDTFNNFTLNTELGVHFEHLFQRKPFQKGEYTPCRITVLGKDGEAVDRCATVLHIDDLYLSVRNILVQYGLFEESARICDKGLSALTKARIADLEAYWDRSIGGCKARATAAMAAVLAAAVEGAAEGAAAAPSARAWL